MDLYDLTVAVLWEHHSSSQSQYLLSEPQLSDQHIEAEVRLFEQFGYSRRGSLEWSLLWVLVLELVVVRGGEGVGVREGKVNLRAAPRVETLLAVGFLAETPRRCRRVGFGQRRPCRCWDLDHWQHLHPSEHWLGAP